MNKEDIKAVLEKVKNGEIEVDDAASFLKDLPFKDLGFAKVDNHRSLRNGYPEVIYCEGKSLDEIEAIVAEMLKHKNNILASRASRKVYQKIKEIKKKINPILKEYGAIKAAVFGSYAKDENSKDSDIDILVEIEDDISLLDFVELRLKLEDELDKEVDLVEYQTIKPAMKENILNNQVPIL